jgi:pyruvate ferredoxin oxidoreductase gamma subunit
LIQRKAATNAGIGGTIASRPGVVRLTQSQTHAAARLIKCVEEEQMFEIRIHGRGGQGVVTAAEMLSIAAFLEGRYALAFPSFGSERTGAPVVAYCRLDDREIRLREPILAPDAVIIQDPTLLNQVDVFSGLVKGGYILINTTRSFEALGLTDFVKDYPPERLHTVPATEIALRRVGRPVPNAALLGAFAAATELISLESVGKAIREKFPAKIAEANILAAADAYSHVRREEGATTHA